jgi:hypothetical protein
LSFVRGFNRSVGTTKQCKIKPPPHNHDEKKFASQTAPKPSWKNAILLAVTAALALFASPGFAADTTWKYDITGDWSISTNWDSGVPGPSSDAFINNGGPA